ncbi:MULTISPECIES: cupin domain-containing protein [Methylotenera]|uniref:cupin domain-containing protein n=1 Tax=Methylotenera TaxID=359407 RepID=UPI00036118E5|nr:MULTISPECIES: cupin domain-containing protein [Methylotenera]
MKKPAIVLATLFLLSLAHNTALALEASKSITVTPLLKTTTSWNGVPIAYPNGQAEITGMLVEIAVGGETGWHLHAVPSFGMMLEGSLEVSLKDGSTKILHAGDALVEVVNTLHNGRNIGNTPVKIVVFYAGVTGSQLTEKSQP